MRDYAKVAPQFWTGRTGKALKASGPEAVIVGMYLMTSPHANMIGVYHCPIAYIAIDTGLTIQGATKGLQWAIEAEFCTFEAETDYVFVHEFAAYQIGDELDPKDKRCAGVRNELAKVPKGNCWRGFRARYAVPFHLPIPTESEAQSEAPSKPLRSQEQEQEQKQEQEQDKTPARKRATPLECPEGVEPQVWTDWLALRKSKKAPVTATVIASATKEAEKAGMKLTAFLTVWCARGSQGLQADWLKPHERGVGRVSADTEPEWRRQQRERNEAFYGPAAASRQPPTMTIEEINDLPIALG